MQPRKSSHSCHCHLSPQIPPKGAFPRARVEGQAASGAAEQGARSTGTSCTHPQPAGGAASGAMVGGLREGLCLLPSFPSHSLSSSPLLPLFLFYSLLLSRPLQVLSSLSFPSPISTSPRLTARWLTGLLSEHLVSAHEAGAQPGARDPVAATPGWALSPRS